MKAVLAVAIAAVALMAAPTLAMADVGQARTSGNGPANRYDRNPSVVADGAATYMFFARSELACNRLATPAGPGCPDNLGYDLYYKKSLDGGRDYGPATLVASNPTGPAGPFYGRTISATATPDGVHVFWASGGSVGPLYHLFKPTGSDTFGSPEQTPGTTPLIFNAWAVSRGQEVLVYSEEYSPTQAITARRYTASGATLTPAGGPTEVPGSNDANIPKAIVDRGGTVRLTMVKPAEGGDYVTSSADGLTFPPPALAAPADEGAIDWDPNLVQNAGGVYFLYFAPDHGNGSQRIGVTSSTDFVHWTATREVTPGQTGGVRYWDYWPEPVLRGNQVVLYYTSERGFTDGDSSTRYPTGQGHVWTDPGFGGLDHLGPAG
jgi:hypothetical protein